MRTLAYLFHCLEQNAERYRRELAKRGHDAEVIAITRNGFSSVYRQLARDEKDGAPSYLDGLLRHHPPQSIDPGAPDAAIVLASWSAGYGYWITLLDEEDSAQRVDAIVGIDSLYASIDHATGKVLRSGLEGVHRYALRARAEEGTQSLWLGYADVPTCYRAGARWEGYASTEQTAEEVDRWIGGGSLDSGFRTHFFDTQRGPRGNHMAAMLEWGPGWLADAVDQLKARRITAGIDRHPLRLPSVPPPPPATELLRDTIRLGSTGYLVELWQECLLQSGLSLGSYGIDGRFGQLTARATRAYQAARGLTADGIVGPLTWATVRVPEGPTEPTVSPRPATNTLGEMIVQVARELQAEGVAEVPGPRAHPVILAMFAACERGGRVGAVALQSDEYAWCAACASYCVSEAMRRLGIDPSSQGWHSRAAVWELHDDAVRAGRFHPASEVRSGEYHPQVGDLWIQVRSGHVASPGSWPFASSGGLGHTGMVTDWDRDVGITIDGNINDTITDVERKLSDPALVGFVSFD